MLPNGLTALLISDPEMADAVAAANGGDGGVHEDGSGAESGSEEVGCGCLKHHQNLELGILQWQLDVLFTLQLQPAMCQ